MIADVDVLTTIAMYRKRLLNRAICSCSRSLWRETARKYGFVVHVESTLCFSGKGPLGSSVRPLGTSRIS